MQPKEVTIYDIAENLSISSATVSRALQNDPRVKKATRIKVSEAAEKMGYRYNAFAAKLRRQHTKTIGVILHELKSNFITSVLAGIEKVTAAAGYDIIIAHSNETVEKEEANALNLFHKRVDGLIASLAFTTKKLDHFKPFINKNIPVIFFDRVDETSSLPKVIIDNYKSAYNATKHLIEQGCKKIAHLTANLNRNVYARRFEGYKKALDDHGIEFNEEWLMVFDLTEEAGIAAAEKLLAFKDRPDGVFGTNDFVVSVCMLALKEKGIKIPEDIAFVGFNNDAISKLVSPKLTTINYPGTYMGEVAARNLIDHLTGITKVGQADTIIISSELIIRASSLKKG